MADPVTKLLDIDGDKFLVVKLDNPEEAEEWEVDITVRPDTPGGAGVCGGQCNGNCNGMKVKALL